jgi:hypothetical protein
MTEKQEEKKEETYRTSENRFLLKNFIHGEIV